jgi:hypothetical protein
MPPKNDVKDYAAILEELKQFAMRQSAVVLVSNQGPRASTECFMGIDTSSGSDHSAFRVRVTKARRPDGTYHYVAVKQKTLDHKLEIVNESDSKCNELNRGLCLPVKSSEGIS